MDAVILKSSDHFKAGAIADVSQARIAMAAEVALENTAVLGAIEHSAPGFEFPDAGWSFLSVDLGHAPIVEILAAAHGVGEVDLPGIAIVDVAHGRGHSA